MVVRVLGRMGPTAKAAVPALVDALQGADAPLRADIHYAFGAIGPDALPAVPALVRSLDDEDQEVHISACYALGRIGPQAVAAVPRLRANLNAEDPVRQLLSAMALLSIRPTDVQLARQMVPLVAAGLEHENELVRLESRGPWARWDRRPAKSPPPLKRLPRIPARRCARRPRLRLESIGSR